MPPHRFQLLAVLAFGVAMLFIENQIQKLEESRARLGESTTNQKNRLLHHPVDHMKDECKQLAHSTWTAEQTRQTQRDR